LPSLTADGDRIEIQSAVITDQKALNSFFVQYPGRQGIMKAFRVTITRQSAGGQPATITRFNGDITLTFQLTAEELAGIDPSSLVVYKRAEDGTITEYTPEFDWENLTLRISTRHLCEFYIMGEKGIPTQRLAGVDRYATAAAISAWGFETSDYVILAAGENFPDALAGTALAAVQEAPVLLTAKDNISSETLAEIKRLKPQTVYLLGGSGVISLKVEETLARTYNVVRISGGDRYATAVRIGELVLNADTAVVVAGADYPDALSIAPFAGQYGWPILFTEKEELNSLTAQSLKQWRIQNVILVGGSGVISTGVENTLQHEMKLNVTRLSGSNRYLTGLEVAKHFTAYPYAALATGNNFPDALAGAALAAKLKMPVLLAGKETISPEIRDYLQELNMKKLYIFGGRSIITDKVLKEINR
jgi:putative cell wall-binding protein